MRADTQVQVLSAINDHGEIQLQMKLDPLPNLLADLELPNGEVNQAVADLHELGLIVGVTVEEFDYPVLVSGLTARGPGAPFAHVVKGARRCRYVSR